MDFLSNRTTNFYRVAYIEGLKQNLLSISQVFDKDHLMTFTKKNCKVKDKDNKVILIGSQMFDVYIINMNSSSENKCFMSKSSYDVNQIWHKRLSHLNFKMLSNISKDQLVTGLPDHTFANESLFSACEKETKPE